MAGVRIVRRLATARMPWIAAVLGAVVLAAPVLGSEPQVQGARGARDGAGVSADADLGSASASVSDAGFVPVPGEVLVRFAEPPSEAGLAGVVGTVPQFVGWVSYPHPALATSRQGPASGRVHPLALRRKMLIDPEADVFEVARRVAQMPGVVWAEPNGRTEMSLEPNDAAYDLQYGPQIIGAPEAWDRSPGGSTHVVLAVADSGLSFSHEEFQRDSAIWRNTGEIANNGIDDDGNGYIDDVRGWDFISDDNFPSDTGGHGTHVAGIAAAGLNNDVGIAGVAGNVTIMPLRVFSAGGGTWEAIELAVYYATDNGAMLINYSGGGSGGTQGLSEASQYAYDNGVVFVAAAGNRNSDNPFYPATYETVIAVSGTDSDDERYRSSSFGDWIDVAAPGVDVYSTFTPYSDSYRYLTGTSMSSPHVAGLVALMYTVDPSLSPDQVRQLLRDNAVDLGDPGFDPLFGYGRIDAAATLAAIGTGEEFCDAFKKMKVSCVDGRLKVVVKMVDGAFEGHPVVVGVEDRSYLAVINRGELRNKAKVSLKDQAGTQTVTLLAPVGCAHRKSAECD